VRQSAAAYDTAQQAVLGSGTQYNYFVGGQERSPEPAVSIAPPFGQLDESLPLRGRDELLDELAGGGPRVRVVHGLGGCGKTRLALEAAFRAGRRGAEVWWVSAARPEALTADMRALGRRLGIGDAELQHGDAADVIWQRLQVRRAPWLLVIDGADDPRLLAGAGSGVAEGRGWLRPLGDPAGTVLVTSRDGSAASWGAWCRRYRLESLPADPAAAMLADHAGRLPALGGVDDARLLAGRLGGLPLALKIAGSYLAEAAAIPVAFADSSAIRSYRQYLDAVQGGAAETLSPAPGSQLTDAQARGLVGRTWELTLDLLDARPMPEARGILTLLASFAAAPVPYQVLLDPGLLAGFPLFPGITGPRLWQVLKTLDDFGLVDLGTEGPHTIPVARLHPLVRDTSRPTADPERPACLMLVARLLGRAALAGENDMDENPAARWIWQLLVPHVIPAFAMFAAGSAGPAAASWVALAAEKTARLLSDQGFHAEAEAQHRDILATRLRVFGPDSLGTLNSRHQIAREMGERGNHAVAEAEQREVLEAALRMLGPDHPGTLSTRHAIGVEIGMQGRHAAAEAEFRDLLSARLRAQGPEHPGTLATQHQIAWEMAAQENYAAAQAGYQEVLSARLRAQGPDHPDTLAARQEIARMMAKQGHHADAEAECRDVLATRLRVQGPDHPLTLSTRLLVASVLDKQGNYAAAEAEYRDILAAQQRVFGPDQPGPQETARRLDDLVRRESDSA
jgi:plasmid stability protein